MRPSSILVGLALFAAPLTAQDLERPEGWMVRLDRPNMTEADIEQFVSMPPGWHITTGHGAGIFYDPEMTASGEYTLSVKIHLFDPGQRHREAYGVFFGGRDLQGEGQRYSYFLLRDTGEFIVKQRTGADAPTVVGWTASGAIEKFAGKGSVPNVLEVRVGVDSVRFSVNGRHAATVARSELATDGVYGLRLNHALNVHVEPFEVKRGR